MRDSDLFVGARRDPLDLRNGIFPVLTDLNNVVGTTPTLISRPSDADDQTKLVLKSAAGTWRMRPGNYTGVTASLVNPGNNNVVLTADPGWATGFGPIRVTAGTTMPTGLSADTDYWVINQATNVIQLAASRQNALDGIFVAFSGAGAGTITFGGPANATVGNGWADAVAPAASVADGYGSFALLAGETLVLPAPESLTVVAFNAADVLDYFFV